MYKWVPNGIYDSVSLLTRYVILDGKPKTVISKPWIENGGPSNIPPELKVPWGTYPDLPEKIKK